LDTAPAGGLLRRVGIAALFMIAARLIIRGLSVVSMVVLARLLVPEDFGLVALAAAAIAFAEVLSVTNYALVLVRKPHVAPALYDAAWTLNLLRCLLLAALVAGTAPWQAAWLGDERITAVLMVVALGMAIEGFNSIGLVRLQRDLRFDLIFRFQVVSRLVSFVVALIIAILLQNYWCLVLGNLAAKIVAVPYSYWIAPHRVRVTLRGAGEMLRFSGWMLSINVLTTAESHGSNLILGRWAGLPALGNFQVAYYLAAVPVHEISVPVRQPIYSGYALVQHDVGMLRRHFLRGLGFIASVLVPLSVGIALTAPQAGRIALGPGWEQAVPLIALCALWSLMDALAAFSVNIFFVLDRLRPYVRTLALLVLLRLPLVLIAVIVWGAVGMAAVMLATAVLNAVIWHWQVARLLGHGIRDVVDETWRSFAAAGIMALVVLTVTHQLAASPDDLGTAVGQFLLLATLGAASHIAAQALLWRLAGAPDGAERRLADMAARTLHGLRSRIGAAPK
jgi:O-antigen/teichoic acid export membrane protein